MKIDELISELEEVKEEHGNLELPWNLCRDDKEDLMQRESPKNEEYDIEVIYLSNKTDMIQVKKD
jgi:hypothetical protein